MGNLSQRAVALPVPFNHPDGCRLCCTMTGQVTLTDDLGNVLAQLPLESAHRIAREVKGYGEGFEDAFGFGDGDGAGFGYGLYGRPYPTGEGGYSKGILR